MSHDNSSQFKYRRDIDGLRALAVLAVLYFHAFTVDLKGGFVGVDVFFVISGYLITAIIVKDVEKGIFSIKEFYKKRILRIFPSLILVLTSCLIIGWFVLFSSEYKMLAKHVISSVGFFSNFTLLAESNYFDISSDLKPLLHLWSLAIEEQFYLLWPVILIFTFRKKLNPVYVIVVLILITFGLNIFYIQQNPTMTFYSPITRSWELLLGGLLSLLNTNKLKKSMMGSHVISIASLILLLSCFIFYSEKISFPGYWALLPVVGTLALIYAGEEACVNKYILSSKFFVSIGLISYPLYLWHWPLISFLRIMDKDVTRPYLIASLALSFLLAFLTYYFIERRVKRNLSWRKPKVLIIFMLSLGATGLALFFMNGLPFRYAHLEEKVQDLGSAQWESKNLISDKECLKKYGSFFKTKEDLWYCKVSDLKKDPSVALIGDSHANSLFPGLSEVYKSKNQNLINLGQGGCVPFYNLQSMPFGKPDECSDIVTSQLDYILSQPLIHTVILSASANYLAPEQNRKRLIKYEDREDIITDAVLAFQRSLITTLEKFSKSNKKIVLVLDYPEVIDPSECADTRPFSFFEKKMISPCAIRKTDYNKKNQTYLLAIKEVLIRFPKTIVWDLSELLCDSEYCWVMKQDRFLYRDDNHLSEYGSKYISDYLNAKGRLN